MEEKIRVIRVMEYEYNELADMLADMQSWAVPPNGHSPKGFRNPIRSTVLPPTIFEREDTDNADAVQPEASEHP